MCTKGHALIRIYHAGHWYLQCCHCSYRILEG